MNNYQKIYLIIFGTLLSIILLFNFISDEFNWNVFDFIIFIIMMIFAVASFELVSRITKKEKSQNSYEEILDKTTKSIEEFIDNTESEQEKNIQ